jgi:thiosulfate dehydrogenase
MSQPRASRPTALFCAAPLALACASEPSELERGRALFQETWDDGSGLNFYRCATCHAETAGGSSQRLTGAPLAGAIERPSFWGGQEDDLLRAINACRTYFMYANAPLRPDDPDAVALYAFLSELAPRDANPVPFDIVRSVEDLPRGNAASGHDLYASACASCHGRIGDGAGALSRRIPVLPDETLEEHTDFSARAQRLVFIEKTRHGGFLGYGGAMPPFSLAALSDAELSDVLEALRLLGE